MYVRDVLFFISLDFDDGDDDNNNINNYDETVNSLVSARDM